jgi:transposase-like protein DUF772
MIELSRSQLSFAEGLIEEEVGSLWEPWMRQVDELLADRELVQIVYEALARRWPKSRTRGRPGTPAEVVLRLLLLKHLRNWSYHVLEREVRTNLVYRQFTRVGAKKVPDAKTLGRLALALGPPDRRAAARPRGRYGTREADHPRTATAPGHHRRGDRHSLSDR